ncbi:MAG: RNA polymerase sigma factor [Candidatus Hydrogenedentes bacterium]|nr:RNA polymerase sigma factor [Candidatus Hydrogenedentota bacterium]
MSAPTPADLLARCVSGDDSARAQFYGDYVDVIRKAVARTLHRYGVLADSGDEMEDLANEVFAKLLADNCALLDRVRSGRSIQAWLIVIARNHVIDHLRRASLRNRAATTLIRDVEPAYVPSHAVTAIAGERIEAVRAGVAGLETRDRLALELYFLQGLTYAQMADILRENVNTVSARVRRAKGKLRQILERQGIIEP